MTSHRRLGARLVALDRARTRRVQQAVRNGGDAGQLARNELAVARDDIAPRLDASSSAWAAHRARPECQRRATLVATCVAVGALPSHSSMRTAREEDLRLAERAVAGRSSRSTRLRWPLADNCATTKRNRERPRCALSGAKLQSAAYIGRRQPCRSSRSTIRPRVLEVCASPRAGAPRRGKRRARARPHRTRRRRTRA
jgi:hypothetical protein